MPVIIREAREKPMGKRRRNKKEIVGVCAHAHCTSGANVALLPAAVCNRAEGYFERDRQLKEEIELLAKEDAVNNRGEELGDGTAKKKDVKPTLGYWCVLVRRVCRACGLGQWKVERVGSRHQGVAGMLVLWRAGLVGRLVGRAMGIMAWAKEIRHAHCWQRLTLYVGQVMPSMQSTCDAIQVMRLGTAAIICARAFHLHRLVCTCRIPGGDGKKHKEYQMPPHLVPPNRLDTDKKLVAKMLRE